jgi:hypothetical protein
MLNMIRQDMENGKAVGLIDPAGDLAEAAIRFVPKDRVKDTIYFNPVECPIGINFVDAKNDAERSLVADDLFVIFQRLSGGGGVRMDAILKRAIQLLVEIPGATFHDLYRIFTDDYFRDSLIRQIKDESAIQFWRDVWPKYPHPVTEEPIVTRMSKFDSQRALKIITSTTSALNFTDVLDGKIFIANISKGLLGLDTSSILGTLLVSQFQLAAFRRANLPQRERTPFYLYIDEFQNFKTSAFNEIVIEARKYQLCLTLANQKLKDLDAETQSAIEAVATKIFFRLVDDDARKFGSAVGRFKASDLMDLRKFNAIIRPGRAAASRRLPVERPPRTPQGFREEIIARTRAAYPSSEPVQPSRLQATDDDVAAGPPPE